MRALKRPLPVSKLDVACGLLWQIMRHILHRLWIGTWLASAAGGIKLQSKSKDEKDHAKMSAKDAALVYHKLHQLSLTGIHLSCLEIFFFPTVMCLPGLYFIGHFTVVSNVGLFASDTFCRRA